MSLRSTSNGTTQGHPTGQAVVSPQDPAVTISSHSKLSSPRVRCIIPALRNRLRKKRKRLHRSTKSIPSGTPLSKYAGVGASKRYAIDEHHKRLHLHHSGAVFCGSKLVIFGLRIKPDTHLDSLSDATVNLSSVNLTSTQNATATTMPKLGQPGRVLSHINRRHSSNELAVASATGAQFNSDPFQRGTPPAAVL